MRTLKLFLVTALAFVATSAQANGPWNRFFQDVSLPTQEVLEHDSWTNALGSSASYVLSGSSVSSSVANLYSSFTNQPDFARNLTLTPTGTTNNVAAGTAVVSGKNIFGRSISENFAITSTQSTATTGAKAFKSISSISFPLASGSGVTLNVGIGVKLGARRCMDNAGEYVQSIFNSIYESTRGTAVASATAIESNTFQPNGSLDGTKNLEFLYMQNFRCYP